MQYHTHRARTSYISFSMLIESLMDVQAGFFATQSTPHLQQMNKAY